MDDEVIKQQQEETKDDGLIYKYNRELFYRFDPEKGYVQQVDYQDAGNQIIIRQSWDAAEQRISETARKVIAGKLSPIAYHMERILMEVPMLAAYMEISPWRVRLHMRPLFFRRLSRKMVEKYAGIFQISADELTNIDSIKP
jgi:hypothetical protein